MATAKGAEACKVDHLIEHSRQVVDRLSRGARQTSERGPS